MTILEKTCLSAMILASYCGVLANMKDDYWVKVFIVVFLCCSCVLFIASGKGRE